MVKAHNLSSKSKGMYLETVSLFKNVYQGKGLVIKMSRQVFYAQIYASMASAFKSIF